MGKYLDKAGFGEIEGEDKYLGVFLVKDSLVCLDWYVCANGVSRGQ